MDQSVSPVQIPYAIPASLATDQAVWSEGSLLYVRNDARLPPRCVKCNAPVAKYLTKKMSWHTPILYLLIVFPGLLIYIVVALIVRKSANVMPGLCLEHSRNRRNGILTSWAIVVAGILMFVLAALLGAEPAYRNSDLPTICVIAGVVLLIGAAVWGMIKTRVLVPKKITPGLAIYKGAHPEFLASIGME